MFIFLHVFGIGISVSIIYFIPHKFLLTSIK